MKASKLAHRIGVSRQWLSKWAQSGTVPGAVRQPNGRWRYEETPALKAWTKCAAARTAAWKRRVLSKGAREAIRAKGRAEWKRQSGYHRRSLAENAFFRLKGCFGERLSAKSFLAQANEMLIRCAALNKLTRLGMPQSYAAAAA